jgi:hypothetical protein
MPITVTPVFPDRTLGPALFEPAADQFYRDIVTAVPQMNSLEVNVNAKEGSAVTSAAQALSSSSQAAAAALSAVGAAPMWVSGTAYAAGQTVWSPISFRTYRRKTTGAGTTDPSIDNSKWSDIFVLRREPTPTVKTAASWDEVSDSYTIPQCPTPQFGCSWNEANDFYSPIIYSY